MKTLKKLLAAVTVLGMLIPLFCLHTMEAAMVYPVWVGGVQVTGANMDDVLGDGAVSYRPGRLTLRNASLTGCSLHTVGNTAQSAACGIYTGQSLDIVVEGECAVDISGHGEAVERSYGIYSEHHCDLTFAGTGTLSVVGGPARERSFGVRGYDPLRVRETVTLKAVGGEASNSRAEGVSTSYGIYARSMVVEDHASVAAGHGPAVKGFGVYCETGELVISGDAVLEAAGKTRAVTAAELAIDERNRSTAWVSHEAGPEGAVQGMTDDFDTYLYVRVGDGSNPFGDVSTTAYYHDAVLWAVEAGVTDGVSPSSFAPGAVCTRGQVVTFLWRAMGRPEPTLTVNPFRDVSTDQYYCKAVLWAVEQGITAGTSPTTFGPDEDCTSAHVVTFLWRAMGQPMPGADSSLALLYAGMYYADSAGWAEAYGLMEGVGSRFMPDAPSPRADIVTYLHRVMGDRAPGFDDGDT